MFVTDDDERAEAEAAATLHHFRRTVDKHNLLGEFGDGFAISGKKLGVALAGAIGAPGTATRAMPASSARAVKVTASRGKRYTSTAAADPE